MGHVSRPTGVCNAQYLDCNAQNLERLQQPINEKDTTFAGFFLFIQN
jgi:hypothetical protein